MYEGFGKDFCESITAFLNTVVAPLCTIVSVILLCVAKKTYNKIGDIRTLLFYAKCQIWIDSLNDLIDDMLLLYIPINSQRGSGYYSEIKKKSISFKKILGKIIKDIPPDVIKKFPLSSKDSIISQVVDASSNGMNVNDAMLKEWHGKVMSTTEFINKMIEKKEKGIVTH